MIDNTVYNEIEKFPSQWLRNLIGAGHISKGVVLEKSIAEVSANEITDAFRFHTFAGLGAWDYALRLAEWPIDAPVWTGSCPCQPFSAAGQRRGSADERHLWPEWLRLITECRPTTIFGEQVASSDGRDWFANVRADLETLGYAVGAADLCAASVGAWHTRQRIFFVAFSDSAGCRWPHRNGEGSQHSRSASAMGDAACERRNRINVLEKQREAVSQTAGPSTVGGSPWGNCEWISCSDGKQRPIEPGSFPVANGAPGRVGQLRAYGNSIVPQVAAAFIRSAMDVMDYCAETD